MNLQMLLSQASETEQRVWTGLPVGVLADLLEEQGDIRAIYVRVSYSPQQQDWLVDEEYGGCLRAEFTTVQEKEGTR